MLRYRIRDLTDEVAIGGRSVVDEAFVKCRNASHKEKDWCGQGIKSPRAILQKTHPSLMVLRDCSKLKSPSLTDRPDPNN